MLVRQSKDLHGSFIDKSELYIGLTVSVNQHSVLVNELAVQKKRQPILNPEINFL